MASQFVIWKSRPVPNGCSVTELFGVEKLYLFSKGVSAKRSFPTDAEFRFDPDFPRNTVLVDNLINVEMMLVCSEKLKAFIETRTPDYLEYLPVRILDHKSKAIGTPYFILHPIDPPDCIDFNQSNVTWSGVDKESILLVKKLVIDESRVEPSRVIFRPKSFYNITLIRRDIAAEIQSHGFSGVSWVELDDYPVPRRKP